jgi:hypothetical protein
VPAHSREVDHVYFPTVGLVRRFTHANSKFLRQFFFFNLFPKFIGIANTNTDHQIFSELPIVKFLKNEFTFIALKPDVITAIPINVKTQFLE